MPRHMWVVIVIPAGRSASARLIVRDVGEVLLVAVLAARVELGALRGVVEVGEARVVELEVGAADVGEALDLQRVDVREVVPEVADVRVDRGVDRGPPAAVVDHARRGDRQLRRARAADGIGEKREVLAEDRVVKRQALVHARPRRRELDRAPVVAEARLHRVLRALDAAELVDEVHVPGGAAQLPVGDRAQADLLLHRDRVANRLVLGGAQLLCGEAALVVRGAGLEQRRRTQQAADVVGAEGRRRPRAAAHDSP